MCNSSFLCYTTYLDNNLLTGGSLQIASLKRLRNIKKFYDEESCIMPEVVLILGCKKNKNDHKNKL